MSSERPYAAKFLGMDSDSTTYLFEADTAYRAYDTYQGSSRTYDDQRTLAMELQGAVSRSFHFQPLASPSSGGPLSAEKLFDTEATNCYGNVIITSELLEELGGIDHYVAFVNQHAFIWMHDQQSGKSHIIDSHPALRQESTLAVTGQPPLEWQIGGGPLSIDLKLDPHALIGSIEGERNKSRAQNSPWLRMNQLEEDFRSQNAREIPLPMRIYPSLPGRDILGLYYDAFIHARDQKFVEAGQNIDLMNSTYPDVDPSNKLKLARTVIKGLVRTGSSDVAVDVAEAVSNSLSVFDRSVQTFLLPDTLRQAAKSGGPPELIKQAIELMTNNKAGGNIRHEKIAAARAELAKRAALS